MTPLQMIRPQPFFGADPSQMAAPQAPMIDTTQAPGSPNALLEALRARQMAQGAAGVPQIQATSPLTALAQGLQGGLQGWANSRALEKEQGVKDASEREVNDALASANPLEALAHAQYQPGRDAFRQLKLADLGRDTWKPVDQDGDGTSDFLTNRAGEVKPYPQTPAQENATFTARYEATTGKQEELNRQNAARIASMKESAVDVYPPEVLRGMAQQYLAGDKSVLQNLGRGKAGERAVRDLRGMIATVAKEMKMSPTQIASKLAEYGAFQHGLNVLGGRSANIDTAAAEAANFAEQAVDASNRVPRGSFVPLTKVVQAGQVMTSDPALAYFATKAIGLAGAAATVAGRGTPNQFLQEEYFHRLATAQDAKSFAETARAILEEARGVSQSTRDVRHEMINDFQGMPHAPPSKPVTKQQYDALPSGSHYTAPDGSDRVKP